MKELERHLGVSYPTARARFDALFDRLGLAPPDRPARPEPTPAGRMQILDALAHGRLDVDEAQRQLATT